MKTIRIMVCALVGFAASCLAEAEPTREPVTATKTDGTVFVLPVNGPIDKSMLFIFRRAFREARAAKPMAVILDIDTPGGGLQETEEIISWIRSLDAPVYAFVNPHALSAGAIISLGSRKIFMAPGSSIGSAMPVAISPIGGGVEQLPADVKEKMLSFVRALVRGLAQENGHSEDVAEAMVDSSKTVTVGERVVCPPGELLNLTAKEATEIIPPATTPLLAESIVEDLPALLKHLGLEGATVVRFEELAAERLARAITMIGPLLLALGILGVYIEIRTPGFGIPGIAGIALLLVYFFGHYVAGLAGWEDMALVVLGLVLLAVEVFVIPGFGIVGILGIAVLSIGVVRGMIPHLPDAFPTLPDLTPEERGPTALDAYLRAAMQRVLVSALLIAGGAWGLGRLLPKTSIYRHLVLQKTLASGDGTVSSDTTAPGLLGCSGVAATMLRPAGIAMFGDARLDVVSSGDLIPKGAQVRVVHVEGNRVVVEQLPPQA